MTSLSKLRFGKELYKLTLSDIQLLIDNKIDESQNLDYKQPSGDIHKDCDNLGEVISAFLNTSGGIIVFGIAENRDNSQHRFPDKIIWTTEPKEKIDQLLLSKVQPYEGVLIQRISNKVKTNEAVYVIQVSKSNNPPHMCNNIYYERLNFLNKPMSHENVNRAFQNSWIRKRDIIEQIIQPLYAEIKGIVEGLFNFTLQMEGEIDSFYQRIRVQDRFLYDKLDSFLQEKIDYFYTEILNLQPRLGSLGFQTTVSIVNQELAESFPDQKATLAKLPLAHVTIVLNVIFSDHINALGERHEMNCLYYALLRKKPVREYIEKELNGKIVQIIPVFKSIEAPFSPNEFEVFWDRCEKRAKKDHRLTEI
jgi:hypothetical protein